MERSDMSGPSVEINLKAKPETAMVKTAQPKRLFRLVVELPAPLTKNPAEGAGLIASIFKIGNAFDLGNSGS
jgi:hypothetical protein